ncbi:MAG: hypothetical protein HY906_27675 [Deltaproteobacteria bacterium]|nr:hypothetical protein [Deltaproteobacteria bacterium]
MPPADDRQPPTTPAPAARRADALARKLAALPEPAMREAVLTEALAGGAPDDLVPLLDEVVARGRAGGPPFDLALLALGGVLATPDALTYERRAALYAAARDGGRYDLADLFLSAGVGPEPAPSAPLNVAGRTLTLGERKSLARGGRREMLDRLMRDPAAPVIRILLGNPRLTERDVVAIAARRPQLPEIQHEIARARRWISRYSVKLALVLNPYTPTDIAVRLIGLLQGPELRQVASEGALCEIVRAAARRRLASE